MTKLCDKILTNHASVLQLYNFICDMTYKLAYSKNVNNVT